MPKLCLTLTCLNKSNYKATITKLLKLSLATIILTSYAIKWFLGTRLKAWKLLTTGDLQNVGNEQEGRKGGYSFGVHIRKFWGPYKKVLTQ